MVARLSWPERIAGAVAVGLALTLIGAAFVTSYRASQSSEPLKVKREVDPLALFQTGVGLLVGFLLTQYMVWRSTSIGTQRDIVGTQARAVADAAAAVHSAFEEWAMEATTDGQVYRRLVGAANRLTREASLLQSVSQHCAVDGLLPPNIGTLVLELKRRATGVDPNQARSAAVRVEDASAAIKRALIVFQVDLTTS